MELNMIYTP